MSESQKLTQACWKLDEYLRQYQGLSDEAELFDPGKGPGLTVGDLRLIRMHVRYEIKDTDMQSVSEDVEPVGEPGSKRVRRLAGENKSE
ncbi:hypothetical protein [Streptomyces sp. CoH17]|uniref:hypothetical protein n=1 Tax=Streptomyces sp. CoH17 TaxID=2992806 RepID=UPI00227052B7|nr:hypothetical protein [Streptomyces sp. CoH17]